MPGPMLAALPDDTGSHLPTEIICEGQYPHHLQGLTGNGKDTLYWSFTDILVKTDLAGKALAQVQVPTHHGDLCFANGKLYVAWSNHFNKPGADSHVYRYDAASLALEETVRVPEADFGAGGMEEHDGHFFIIGGLPQGYEENWVHEYDGELHYLRTHLLPSGYTNLGIQTVCFHDGFWWFGCYTVEGHKGLLKADEDFHLVGIYDVSPAIGLVGWGQGRFWMAVHFGEQWHAKAVAMEADEELGLVAVK